MRRHLGSVVGPEEGPAAALNAAAWTDGLFVHVPKGVRLELPLQSFLRLETRRRGRFERILIVAEEGAELEFLEGCSAPGGAAALRSGVVELALGAGAVVRYRTLQHWPLGVYNLTAKRARLGPEARLDWVDANLGSGVTVKHPSALLAGPKASADLLVCGLAGRGQTLDTGGELVFAAPDGRASLRQRCAAREGGRVLCRTSARVGPGARGARAELSGEALLLDARSRVDFFPRVEAEAEDARVAQALSLTDIAERLHYLRSRGLGAPEALRLALEGFFEPAARALPLEFAVEFARLLELELSTPGPSASGQLD